MKKFLFVIFALVAAIFGAAKYISYRGVHIAPNEGLILNKTAGYIVNVKYGDASSQKFCVGVYNRIRYESEFIGSIQDVPVFVYNISSGVKLILDAYNIMQSSETVRWIIIDEYNENAPLYIGDFKVIQDGNEIRGNICGKEIRIAKLVDTASASFEERERAWKYDMFLINDRTLGSMVYIENLNANNSAMPSKFHYYIGNKLSVWRGALDNIKVDADDSNPSRSGNIVKLPLDTVNAMHRCEERKLSGSTQERRCDKMEYYTLLLAGDVWTLSSNENFRICFKVASVSGHEIIQDPFSLRDFDKRIHQSAHYKLSLSGNQLAMLDMNGFVVSGAGDLFHNYQRDYIVVPFFEGER